MIKIILMLTVICCGCAAAHKPKPTIGAPPNFEGKCQPGYKYRFWTGHCELEDHHAK